MYSPSVIERRRLAIQKHLGFLPERSSKDKIVYLITTIDSITRFDPNGTPIGFSEAPPDWLIKAIRNEIEMCRLDFRYWCENYAIIRSDTAELVNCNLLRSQEILLSEWAEMEENSFALYLIICKARQLGLSTLIELAIAHRIQFYPNVKAVVASSDPRKSERMSQMMFLCWDHQPWWLKPKQDTNRTGVYAKFSHGSEIYIEHGSRSSGIARGTTPSIVHLSELPDWPNPEELIDNALMRAIHPDPWKMVILESTAKGLYNWWHKKWKASQLWPRSKFRPIFLPWFTDELYWPTPTWLRQTGWDDIKDTWEPSPETVLHAEKAAEAVATDALLKKHFPVGWTMPRHQMYFYECDKVEHIKEGQLAGFLSEMPSNHIEAFQSNAYSLFSPEVIDYHQSQTVPPIAMYGFVGRLIPIHLQPTMYEIDFSYESDPSAPAPVRIDIRGSDDPNACFTITLVPLRMDSYLSTTEPEPPFGKLLVYETPRKGVDYGFGVDTAEGIGQDRTVIEGYRKGIPGIQRNYQICEFASPYINSVDLVPILMAIATWYSPVMGGEMRQAKVVIECAGNGETTQLEMKKRGWSNFHEWLRYDNKITRRSSARKIGWMTRGWSRSMMLDYLIKALKDDWLVIRSPWFVEEMRDLKKEEDSNRAEAVAGAFDDRIMAMAMVNLSMWDLELYSGPMDTRMREVREPQKTYPLLTIPRPTGQRYESPGDYLSGETDWTAPEDEDQGAYAYD